MCPGSIAWYLASIVIFCRKVRRRSVEATIPAAIALPGMQDDYAFTPYSLQRKKTFDLLKQIVNKFHRYYAAVISSEAKHSESLVLLKATN